MANATWDAATVTAVTLSGGNLIATNTGTTSADQGARVATANGKTSGKYYFEATWTTRNQIGGNFGIGIGTPTSTYTSMGNGGTTGIEQYNGGSFYSNGSQVSGGSGQWNQGQTAGIAVDLDNRRFWTRTNPAGVWNGSGTNDPATNVGGFTIPAGTMVPFVTFGGSGGAAGSALTANFGDSAFTGAVPSGFTAGWPAAGTGPPAKDQSGTNTSTGGTTTTIAVTSAASSVVVVGACVGSTSTTTIPTLSIAGAGLTWNSAPPGSGIGNVNFRMAVRCFWAYTASALTAQTVTITSSLAIDAAATGYETLTGANAASPADPNALSTFGSFGASTTGTITTTNANDTCIVVIGSNYNTGPAVPVGSGVRDLNTVASNGLFAYFALGRWPYTSAQTGATVGFTGVGAAGGLSAITLTADAAAVASSQARVMVMA